MPTYEYRCPNGHHFERFAKMSESAAELPCPECGELAARQLSGGAGLVFKGSGFYLTDYGRNAHRGGSGPEHKHSESKSGDSKSSDAKSSDAKSSESKPADSKAGDSKSSSSGSAPSTPASGSSNGPSSGNSPKSDK